MNMEGITNNNATVIKLSLSKYTNAEDFFKNS